MRRVIVVATGGTIASRYSAEDGAVVSIAKGDELVTTLSSSLANIKVCTEQFSNVGSYSIDLPSAFQLARRLEALLGDDAIAGVVVTHGTDTMEESAYLSDLVIPSEKPVVFTGAQRRADDPSSDGPRNLADAVRVAADPAARGLGALIVFDQEIHAARDASKTHTSRVGAFTSAEHGKLGEIDGDEVIIQRRPIRRGVIETSRIDPCVDLIKTAMGCDDRLVRFAAESGARAIVLEAFGRGNAPPAVTEAVAQVIRRGVHVAITSRAPQGRVAPIYGRGGGADLAAAGALFAGDLSSIKTRVLLAVLLGAGADPATIRDALKHHGC